VTQSARILQALADGKWHDAASLYQLGCVLHSRISDLRKRGHLIETRHVGGTGARAYEYRLVPLGERSGQHQHEPPARDASGGLDGPLRSPSGDDSPYLPGSTDLTVAAPIDGQISIDDLIGSAA
jgi:hypothetical protein